MSAAATIDRLLLANVLREPVLGAAIDALCLPAGSRGLDVGCGIGLQAVQLARAVGTGGRVVGLDIDRDVLGFARRLIRQARLAGRVSFRIGDMAALPFPDGSFDWVWSADCVGYPAGNLPLALRELTRVLRPGGTVALLGWSSQQLLPGHAALEARLNGAFSAYRPFLDGFAPEAHFGRALRWLRAAGLEEVEARTFVGTVAAPLDASERAALESLFEMLWMPPSEATSDEAAADGAASDETWSEWCRLRAAEPGGLLDDPGYSAFFTCSLFSGRLPAIE